MIVQKATWSNNHSYKSTKIRHVNCRQRVHAKPSTDPMPAQCLPNVYGVGYTLKRRCVGLSPMRRDCLTYINNATSDLHEHDPTQLVLHITRPESLHLHQYFGCQRLSRIVGIALIPSLSRARTALESTLKQLHRPECVCMPSYGPTCAEITSLVWINCKILLLNQVIYPLSLSRRIYAGYMGPLGCGGVQEAYKYVHNTWK